MKKFLLALLIAAAILPARAKDKPMLMWFDATANFSRLSYPDSIRYYLDKVKSLGFTDVVVDVKPITGEVLFPSRYAPLMKEWDKFHRPQTFDFLQTFISESHKRKLRIHASLNIFVAGHNFFDRGIVYTQHPEWASIIYTDSGMVPITKLKKKYSAMTNPADTSVQRHELDVLRELVTKYAVDGVILDRVRYDDLHADFSPLSRALFEKHLGKKIDHFPADIFEWKKAADGSLQSRPGPYFRQWVEWRATIIHDFMAKARQTVKKARPSVSFGDYTGAWYPIYYQVGVNWASRNYDPSKEYKWASPTYKKTGYAELLDLYTTGNYYFEVTKDELKASDKKGTTETGTGSGKEPWYSVEGSCEIVKKVLKGAVPAYGGIYVEQYRDHPAQFEKAIAMNLKKSDGLMVFDIVHIISMDWWDALARGIAQGRQ
ncbi:MAG: alpha amylase family protein [Acidobacteriota bacterium]